MRNSNVIFLIVFVLLSIGVTAQERSNKKHKKTVYEEVDFEDMMHRYLGKETSSPVEGIYTVSCVIIKRNRKFLSKNERIRVVERKDNYARIAILKDWPGSKRDFIEVSLSYRDARKFPIVGELNALSERQGFMYRHFEPDGSSVTFSMINEADEMLEAEYSEMQKRQTITYRLSYLKTYPRTSDMTVFNK